MVEEEPENPGLLLVLVLVEVVEYLLRLVEEDFVEVVVTILLLLHQDH